MNPNTKGYRYDWTDKDSVIVRMFNHGFTYQQIADRINMPVNVVRDHGRLIGLRRFCHIKWTREILLNIKIAYPSKGAPYLSRKFDIPVTAINKQAQVMGVKRKPKHTCLTTQGYVNITLPDGRRENEHRLVMESVLGRRLLSSEIVHHKDEDKTNNDPSNLELTTRSEHINMHREELLRGRYSLNRSTRKFRGRS